MKWKNKTMKRNQHGGDDGKGNSDNSPTNISPSTQAISNDKEEEEGGKEKHNGYIEKIKKNLAGKVSGFVNRIVSKQVESRLLRCLPPKVKEDLSKKIEGSIQSMTEDITSKSLDTGENVLKASPALGNAVSAVSALDKVVAGVQNAKANIVKIQDEITKAQENLNEVSAQTGGGPEVSNKLQTILKRAHRSISQHHADVHHLIEHRNKIHAYRNKKNTKTHKNKQHSQLGGQAVTNNFQTILNRAHHSVSQHHADVHHLIEHRDKIHAYRNTTKKSRR
jgi:hypothetical protein